MESESEELKLVKGEWELETCVVCKFPKEYCICRKIHAGGD